MTASFRAEQRGVAGRMAAAFAVVVGGFALAARYGSSAPFPERLEAAAWASAAALAWLAAAIGDVARRRFFSATDIGGAGDGAAGEASPTVAQARAVLGNTLEQAALAVPVYLLLALVEPRAVAPIAVMGTCFSVGRLLFWTGYAQGARARALGFALTFYPSVGALLWLVAALAR